MGAYHVSGSLQINGFAFGEAATHLHWNLERQSDRAPTFRVSGSLHKDAFAMGHWDRVEMVPRKAKKGKENKDLALLVLLPVWLPSHLEVVAERTSKTAFVNCSVFAFPPTSLVV